MGDYRKFEVWHRARQLVRRIQVLVRELPEEERSVRGEQLRQACTSIRYNIAEGAGLNSDPLLSKHLRYALGSANEVQDQLLDLDDQGLLQARDQDLHAEVSEIRSMLASFKHRVDTDIAKSKRGKSAARSAAQSESLKLSADS
jgi:four helix bundle protein